MRRFQGGRPFLPLARQVHRPLRATIMASHPALTSLFRGAQPPSGCGTSSCVSPGRSARKQKGSPGFPCRRRLYAGGRRRSTGSSASRSGSGLVWLRTYSSGACPPHGAHERVCDCGRGETNDPPDRPEPSLGSGLAIHPGGLVIPPGCAAVVTDDPHCSGACAQTRDR